MPRLIDSTMTLLILMILVLSPASAYSQRGNEKVILATGKASLDLPAERMLLAVDLIARHQDVREAVTSLQDRIEAATAQVKALGAISESIKIAAPKIAAAQSNAQQRLRAQVLEGFDRASRGADASALQPMVTVTARLTAEWNLDGADAIERMSAAYQLQQQLKAAKLSGADETEGLSEEEQELLEEAQMMMSNNYYSDEQQPGEPKFLYYADVSGEERDAALKQAFDNAKAQAGQLAKAAGVGLGELQSLQDASAIAGLAQGLGYDFSYGGSDYQALQFAAEWLTADAGASKAIGIEPGTLKYSVQLSVGFQIAR